MAGDWIPRCKGLNRKPEVLQISRVTGMDRRVVSDMLMEFWEWADSETADGAISGLTISQLVDAIPGSSEVFWLAVVRSNWLLVDQDGIRLPKFERWLGQSAKKRLENTVRQSVSRKSRDKGATTGQYRTEELGDESPKTPLAPSRSTDSEPTVENSSTGNDSENKTSDVKPRSGSGVQDRVGLTATDQAGIVDQAGDSVVLYFPVVGGKRRGGPAEWPLTAAKVAEYAGSFPGIDVLAECRAARQWCRDNPTKQKTWNGMPAFLNRWLARAQNAPAKQKSRTTLREKIAARGKVES